MTCMFPARRRAPLLVLALLSAAQVSAQQAAVREPLSVMSFNIRYGTAKDGDNHWSLRKEMLFDLVRDRVTNGKGGMPAFRGELEPEEIDALAEYVDAAAAG